MGIDFLLWNELGTAVVTDSKAALWTDGRYYLQASKELNDQWTLMKSGLSDTPSIPKWLLSQVRFIIRISFGNFEGN